jgi:hypothetical protein
VKTREDEAEEGVANGEENVLAAREADGAGEEGTAVADAGC